jgi:hypothetical protein
MYQYKTGYMEDDVYERAVVLNDEDGKSTCFCDCVLCNLEYIISFFSHLLHIQIL